LLCHPDRSGWHSLFANVSHEAEGSWHNLNPTQTPVYELS